VTSPELQGAAQFVRASAGFHLILEPLMMYCLVSWEQQTVSPFFCAIAQLIKQRLTLPSYLAITMTNAVDFGLSEPQLFPPLYRRMLETNAQLDLLEFLVPRPAPPSYLAKA
jgi:hypothetical protein